MKYNNYNNYNYKIVNTKDITVSNAKYSKSMFGEEKWIPIEQIKVDISVQRELQESHVNKILKKFDPNAFGRLTVSKREDGFYYCSDGQHRLNVARRLGFKEVPCIVINNYTIKEEGENFIKVNEMSAKVSMLDKYRIGVSCEMEDWIRVKEVLDYAGLEAGTGVNKVSCISVIYKIINGATLLSSIEKNVVIMKKSLYILKEIVGVKGINNQMVSGMSIFVRNYIITGETDTQTTIERLRKVDAKVIISKAQDMRDNAVKGKVNSYVAYLFWNEFNKGLKFKLPLKIEL